jgi:hypothetical protein
MARQVEIWKDIPGMHGYQASTLGQVRAFGLSKRKTLMLSTTAVEDILTSKGRGSGVRIAEKYGVCDSVVSQLRRGLYDHRKPRDHLLKPTPDRKGYMRVSLGKKRVAVHKLVLITFVGEMPPECTGVRHLNDIKDDNRLTNLRWGTNEDQRADIRRNSPGKFSSDTRGVSWHKTNRHWQANSWCKETKRTIFLGSFDSESEAAAVMKEYYANIRNI